MKTVFGATLTFADKFAIVFVVSHLIKSSKDPKRKLVSLYLKLKRFLVAYFYN